MIPADVFVCVNAFVHVTWKDSHLLVFDVHALHMQALEQTGDNMVPNLFQFIFSSPLKTLTMAQLLIDNFGNY